MSMEFPDRPLKRMISFEIETCPRTRSRDIDAYSSSETVWDDEKPSSTRWNPLRRNVPEASPTNKDKIIHTEFLNDLAEARLDDVTDLEMLDFVRIGPRDNKGRETLIFVAKYIPNEIIQLERTQRFILHKIESIGQKSFNVLYIHTGSNLWTSQLGLKVTWNLFSRIPRLYQGRLHRFYILHADIYVQLTMWFVVRWFMFHLWEKIHYLPRVEDIDSYFPAQSVQLPSFIEEHDEELAKHPLMDYGFCTLSEVDNSSTTTGPFFYT